MGLRITVCDVGLGNLRSVERALREASRAHSVAVDVEVTRDPARLRAADKLVMPGQGAFGDCARALVGGLGDAVREHVAAGRPYLGICLGLQVLFGTSEEAPGCAGLGLLEGHVEKLQAGIDPSTGTPRKIPHVGWNVAEPAPDHRGLLPEGAPLHFYFVHSYVVVPREARVVAATTDYGARFVSAVAYDNVFACQFHPEKSQRAGLALLERFVAS
jgi:glutamine amidotransferase